MLTRIEIDGFKSFEQFSLDVAPFTVILGPNASGKSNLFDAILLLSQLAATDLRSALKGLRGEPLELFRRQADGSSSPQMSFAVELLLAPQVRDPWGEVVELSHSRVRYEVQIEYRKGDRHLDHLRITQESVTPILKPEDQWGSKNPAIDAYFSELFLKYNRKEPWLTTEETEGKRIFKISPDTRVKRYLPSLRKQQFSVAFLALNFLTFMLCARSYFLGVFCNSIPLPFAMPVPVLLLLI